MKFNIEYDIIIKRHIISLNIFIPRSFGGKWSFTMAESTILRETKGMQKGFVKEDVMTYIDELNSRIVSLEDEIKKGAPANNVDQQEIIKYRNQVDNLQEKLNASNNALRAAKKENEELQKQHESDQNLINQLKAGGSGAAAAVAQSNAQTTAALEAARKEIDRLKAQLQDNQKKESAAASQQQNAQAAQATAALEAAKKEIDKLRAQLKEAQSKPAAVPQAAPAPAEQAANNAELAKTKQEISRLTSELGSKAKEIAERDKTIAQINKEKDEAASKIKDKDAEITKLNSEIVTLKESANDPTAQMGLIFAEAQKTVNMLKTQAKTEADKTMADANEKADAILREANSKAEKTINDANITAEACIKEANEQAKATVDDANKHADKVNEMSSTVRSMLLNEIESVNVKFNDISSVLGRLTSQATDRMSEAQLIIGEAKKSVGSGDTVKKAEAPKADFKASEAPKVSLSDLGKDNSSSPAGEADPFASIGSAGSYASKNHGYNNAGSSHNSKPAPAPQPKQSPSPKKNNFSFDMEALLKAAEEEAAKNPEE